MRVTAISGYGVKGPACFLVQIAGRRLILDMGEGPDGDRRPDLSGLEPVDGVLVSHGHRDHVGALERAASLGDPPVYATRMTIAGGEGAPLARARPLPLRGKTTIAGLDVETGRASHAPGGVWMRIGGPEGVLYTGDFTLESGLYPFDPPPPAAALILDCAYGVHDAPLARGREAIREAARKGPLLLPAPPDGRGLEMAIALMGDAPVRLCAAHRAVVERLLAGKEAQVLSEAGRRALADLAAQAGDLSGEVKLAGVMIAAKASADSGLAAALVSRACEESVRIIFTGHLAQGSKANALVAAKQAEFIRWNVHPRLGDLKWLLGLTKPCIVLPAFLPGDRLDALRRALPEYRLSDAATIAW